MFIHFEHHGSMVKLLGDAPPASTICKPQLCWDISIDEVYLLFILRIMEIESQSQDPMKILPLAMQSIMGTFEHLFHKPSSVPQHPRYLPPNCPTTKEGTGSCKTIQISTFPKI